MTDSAQIMDAIEGWWGSCDSSQTYKVGGSFYPGRPEGAENWCLRWTTEGGRLELIQYSETDEPFDEINYISNTKGGGRYGKAEDILDVRRKKVVEDFEKRETIVTLVFYFKNEEIELTKRLKWNN